MCEEGDLTCNSSSQRFPTLLFSAAVRLCSNVSSHVVISALAGSLLKVKDQQHNIISLGQSMPWALFQSELELFAPLSGSAVLSLFTPSLFKSMPRDGVHSEQIRTEGDPLLSGIIVQYCDMA